MCGAVRFTARNVPSEYGACHCEQCRRWAGSALLAVTVATDDIAVEGGDNIARIQSSAWAERAWCGKCGSGLWYRVTAEGSLYGNTEIPVGLLDDTTGMSLVSEIFHDVRCQGFDLANDTRKMTRAEVFAKYAPGLPQEGENDDQN
ncbi:MAG: GFA family protein [Rhodobacteraceae bacterium]|nr:GFA family protein [Paracoccaceae bacterium]